MIQWMLAIWSLLPLPFLNPTWTFGSSRFMYCWSLTWRILSITLLAVRWVQSWCSLSILWHCLSLGLEWKLTFSSLVAIIFTNEKNLSTKINWAYLCHGYFWEGLERERERVSLSKCETFSFIILSRISNIESGYFRVLTSISLCMC